MKTFYGIIILVLLLCGATVHSKFAASRTYTTSTKCTGPATLSVNEPLDTCLQTGSLFSKSKMLTLKDNKITTMSYKSTDCTGTSSSTTTTGEVGKCMVLLGVYGMETIVLTDDEVTAAKAGALVSTTFKGSNECKKAEGYYQKLTIYDASWNGKCVTNKFQSSKFSWTSTTYTTKSYSLKKTCSGTPTVTQSSALDKCTNTSATESVMWSSNVASPASLPLLAFNALMFAFVVGISLLQ